MTQSLLFQDNPPESLVESKVDLARKASVLVPFPVDKAYTYAMPEGADLQPGDYVWFRSAGAKCREWCGMIRRMK